MKRYFLKKDEKKIDCYFCKINQNNGRWFKFGKKEKLIREGAGLWKLMSGGLDEYSSKYLMRFEGGIKQHLTKVLPTILSDLGLLSWVTVILETEHNWIIRCFKGTLCYRLDHISSVYFRHKRVSAHIDSIFCFLFFVAITFLMELTTSQLIFNPSLLNYRTKHAIFYSYRIS